MEKKVLFLCTKNSARSQMAEAILNTKGNANFIAFSAGSQPADDINTYAQVVMEEIGIDISGYKPKSVEQFLNEEFDFIITLCDKAKNECPTLLNDAIYAHWGITDPRDFKGTEEEIINHFKKIRNELTTRINLFMSLPIDKLNKATFRKKLDEMISK
jgi:arsenate reductase